MADSPFGTWNGQAPLELFPGVRLNAFGGDQLLLCRVTYEPGKTVPRHSHAATEQLMVILAGEVTITVEDETRTVRAGDVVCINRGLEHELVSETGVTFIEGLAPVPLDHVPDRDRDLVLGDQGGTGHVER
jgi:quercetin dioxygenase-like cupin family protein